MSVEDKIRRAEEIYNRRRENTTKYNTAKVNVNSKKDFKLFKKMVWQIIICLLIYSTFYFCIMNNYVFSEDLKNKVNEILSYDINFEEIYSNLYNTYNNIFGEKQNPNTNNENVDSKNNAQDYKEDNSIETTEQQDTASIEEVSQEQSIGGAVEENDTTNQENVNLSQEEQDVIDVKNALSFIVPVEGYVSSTYGIRNPTTSTVPKNHTGLDIAAASGTVIKSATDGVVTLASSEGDYGNHLKIANGDITMVYAHCKTLYVKEGDTIKQGQNIAEVGTTGNSTGPHLHFEIRKADRFINPQKIINI